MALAPSSMGKYQLVVLGSTGDPHVSTCASRLDAALKLAFSHLGVDDKKFLTRVTLGTSSSNIDPRMPLVGVFFGLAPALLSADDTAKLALLLKEGVLIIPVVSDTSSFATLVPPISPTSMEFRLPIAVLTLSVSPHVFSKVLVF